MKTNGHLFISLKMVSFFAAFCKKKNLYSLKGCVDCKQLEKELERTNFLLQNRIEIGALDCKESRDICEKYEITKLPTLSIFK